LSRLKITLLRKYIKKIVQESAELSIVGEANDGLELLKLLEQSLHIAILLRDAPGGGQSESRWPFQKFGYFFEQMHSRLSLGGL
jgi:DNA-binding NarL/FixJ family response regulator